MEAPRRCCEPGAGRRCCSVGRGCCRRGRRGRGGARSRRVLRRLGARLAGWGHLIGAALLRLHGLLARVRRIVGDVPAVTFEDERRRREQTLQRSAARLTAGERWLGDALPDLERPMTLITLIFVCGHEIDATWEAEGCQDNERS